MQKALDDLWPYTGEMFEDDEIDQVMQSECIAPLPSSLQKFWNQTVESVLSEAYLTKPNDGFSHSGGRQGTRHTEHLGHMLATIQFLQRAYPGASW